MSIGELTTALLAISAITKTTIDLLKAYFPRIQEDPRMKQTLSLLLPIVFCLFTNISLFEKANTTLFYLGVVGAGLIAGLGSNFIHEVMKVLQTLKDLRR